MDGLGAYVARPHHQRLSLSRLSVQLFYRAVEPMPDPSVVYRFDFYEKVRITGDRPELASIRGELAAVLGRALDGDVPVYAVSIYASGECWHVDERELEPTDEFDRRETFYPGETVRVSVRPDGFGTAL